MISSGSVDNVGEEFLEARLGDERRSRRARQIAQDIVRDPGRSFPKVFEGKAGLEAFYRFVNNGAVSYEALIDSHAEETVMASRGEGLVLSVHDTSAFVFDPHVVDGIGYLTKKTHGFLGHFALAVSADGQHGRWVCWGCFRVFAHTGVDR